MAKGHRSQIKRERNANKDTRPSAKLSYARVSGMDSIRDVIAFPKVKDASCLMTDAPNVVDAVQLKELGIDIAEEEQM